MWFRALSGLMTLFSACAAGLQLDDPDSGRWLLMYGAVALLGLLAALGWLIPRLALLAFLVAGLWALAIAPELYGKWELGDLLETINDARPEIVFGRELGSLSVLASYCWLAYRVMRQKSE
jgi:hypothetical protein